MTPDLVAGIDPGLSGGIALLDLSGSIIGAWPIPETEREVVELLAEFGPRIARTALERVQPMPTGTIAMFKLGKSYGTLIGILSVLQIPFDEVPPKQWQKGVGCIFPPKVNGKRNNKAITRQKAQSLFPKLKITNAIADALLIAEHCRRLYR